MFAPAANFHDAGLFSVFAVFTAVLAVRGARALANAVSALLFLVFCHYDLLSCCCLCANAKTLKRRGQVKPTGGLLRFGPDDDRSFGGS